jgi:hypothetical protein
MESLTAIVPLVPKVFTRRSAVRVMRRESSVPERVSIPGLGATPHARGDHEETRDMQSHRIGHYRVLIDFSTLLDGSVPCRRSLQMHARLRSLAASVHQK